jgi:hypothetical protein
MMPGRVHTSAVLRSWTTGSSSGRPSASNRTAWVNLTLCSPASQHSAPRSALQVAHSSVATLHWCHIPNPFVLRFCDFNRQNRANKKLACSEHELSKVRRVILSLRKLLPLDERRYVSRWLRLLQLSIYQSPQAEWVFVLQRLGQQGCGKVLITKRTQETLDGHRSD